MVKKFLKEHFTIAWSIAVNNCNKLLDGLVDLNQKKSFVSSLQNAIEIGFKQLMIDQSNHKILKYGNMEVEDAKEFLNSSDLNFYFDNLYKGNKEKFDKIYSIDFKDLIDKSKEFFNNNSIIKEKLRLLQKIRNSETHFYINEDDYLKIDDFKELCELMVIVQDKFKEKKLLEINHAFGSIAKNDKDNIIYFSYDKNSLISYDDLINNGKTNKEILKEIYDEKGFSILISDKNDLYNIAYQTFTSQGFENNNNLQLNFTVSFDEFYRRFILLHKNGKIGIREHDDYDECEGYSPRPYIIYRKN